MEEGSKGLRISDSDQPEKEFERSEETLRKEVKEKLYDQKAKERGRLLCADSCLYKGRQQKSVWKMGDSKKEGEITRTTSDVVVGCREKS